MELTDLGLFLESCVKKLFSLKGVYRVYCTELCHGKTGLKAMYDIGVIMTPFGDVVTVSLVVKATIEKQLPVDLMGIHA